MSRRKQNMMKDEDGDLSTWYFNTKSRALDLIPDVALVWQSLKLQGVAILSSYFKRSPTWAGG